VAEFQAGEVVVPVVPSADGFIKTLRKQLVPGAYQVGQDIGKEIQRGISDQLKGVYEPLKRETERRPGKGSVKPNPMWPSSIFICRGGVEFN